MLFNKGAIHPAIRLKSLRSHPGKVVLGPTTIKCGWLPYVWWGFCLLILMENLMHLKDFLPKLSYKFECKQRECRTRVVRGWEIPYCNLRYFHWKLNSILLLGAGIPAKPSIFLASVCVSVWLIDPPIASYVGRLLLHLLSLTHRKREAQIYLPLI